MESTSPHSDHATLISIRNLSKSFDGRAVLKDISLNVLQGENMCILGRSGSGKSVLIKMLVGLMRPDQGEVHVLGHDVEKLSPKELDVLRLRIGFAFQNSALYDSMNVRENLEFPLHINRPHLKPNEVNAAVENVLDAVGLIHLANSMPSELSGGQRKRIGIARTLILNPEIMLYDEPTSGLDPITSEEINNLINSVQKKYNTTSIIITHDLTCARETSDRVAMMLDGEFIWTGKFQELFLSENEEIKNFIHYNFIQ